MCAEITLSDHQEVYEKLDKVSVQWRELGGALELDQGTLSAIEIQSPQEHSLYGMLIKRLQSGGPLSWRVLCDCLRSPAVGRDDVAAEIEKEIGTYVCIMMVVSIPLIIIISLLHCYIVILFQ